MNIKINIDKHKEICDLYFSGVGPTVLAQKYGVSRKTIIRIIKKYHSFKKKRYRKFSFNQNYFDKINTEEKAYFLGLLYADGNNSKKLDTIRIILKDLDILEKFKNEIEYTGEIKRISKKLNGKIFFYHQLSLFSSEFSKKLSDFGLIPNKSMTMTFPDESKVPNDLIHHFIRGYFDGDGSISFNSKRKFANVSILSNESFSSKIYDILKNKININIYKIFHKNKKSLYLCINGNIQSKIFLDYLYINSKVHMDRKYNLYMDFVKNRKQIAKGSGSSKYFGVCKRGQRWDATGYDFLNKKPFRIGYFDTEEDAALAYDQYCIKNRYNYYRLNFEYPEIKDGHEWFCFRRDMPSRKIIKSKS